MAIQEYIVSKSNWKKVSRTGKSGSIRNITLPEDHYVAFSHTSSLSSDTVALTTSHLKIRTAIHIRNIGLSYGINFTADDPNDTWYAVLVGNRIDSSSTLTCTVATDDN